MKIAILHNYLDNIGGAQMVLFTLARELGADVYSTVADEQATANMGFTTSVKTIGWIPINAPLRQQLAAARFRHLNLKGQYDFFIIAGDWALSAAVHNKPNLWYCHSPSRELWDLYEYTRDKSVPPLARGPYDVWVRYNRRLNHRYLDHVQTVVCSSQNAQQRLKRYLGREAPVVYPPIDVDKYKHMPSDGYWLSVNRLIPYKRIELQLEVFRQMTDKRLIIVGASEPARHFKAYEQHIRRLLPPNVTLLEAVDAEQLRNLYARCEGFITTSHNEDFGLTALEAMAAGKPVVAVNEGGYKETVVHNVTGKLVEPHGAALTAAVREISADPSRYRAAAQKRAAQFDTRVFIATMKHYISSRLQVT